MEEEKRRFEIDWEELLGSDEQPPIVVILNSKTHGGAPAETSAVEAAAGMEEQLGDHELLERIKSTKCSLSKMAHKLPDKGEKLRGSLKRLEEEWDKRSLRAKRVETIHLEDSDGFENSERSTRFDTKSGSDFTRETTLPQDNKDPPSFASIFLKRIDSEKSDWKSNAFDKEISLLSPCDQQRQRRKRNSQPTTRHSPPKRNQTFSCRGKQILSSGNGNSRASSTGSVDIREIFANHDNKTKKDSLPFSNISISNVARPKKERTIVLVDEEEAQLIETLQQLEKPDESMKDVKIYYPSSDHSHCVEISYTDFDCLAPQSFLRSNIMNFYIRYLQQHTSPTNSVMRNCHFFNTYFYDKLKEVLSQKEFSRDDFFVKFRRWWKGINIFQKEYILVPINQDYHWSLAIICILDKEEQSGPIILHLDSLGLHSSESVFENIKSYLIQEWNHLRREATCLESDFPFPDNIWQNLSSRITDKPITVPQQRNDYDCGLFVLYFMERFIEDAPGRLTKKDLAMFGKQWFKPEEASGLRVKINKLLLEEFKKAKETEKDTSQSSPSSSLPDVVEV